MQVWIGRNGERFGPYADDEVRGWLRDGTCRPEELGWYEGMADWRPLGELFPDDRPAPGSAPPPPPPPRDSRPFMGITDADVVPEYAGFWVRFGAWLIDYIIITVPASFLAVAFGFQGAISRLFEGMEHDQTAAFAAYVDATRPFAVAVLFVGFAYYALFEASKWQATPGKMALGIRVTDTSGQRLTLARAAGRNVIRLANAVPFLSILPMIFYITAAFSERKQGIHDMLAGTYVLKGRADAAPQVARPQRPGGSFDA